MATQFEIDCAIMAGASYYDTRADKNRFPIPDGWVKITDPDSHYSDSSSGFEAVSFRSSSNPNEIVISFAGTYLTPSDLRDAEADINLANGIGSEQLLQAAEYYLQVKAANPDANITLTGHSLGGGLAALIGVFFGVKAVTFDQAPFALSAESNLLTPDVAANLRSDLLLKGYSELDLVPLDNYLQLRAANGGDIPNSSLATNIRVDGEFLSCLPTNILFDPIGTTPPENVLTHGPYTNPSMDMHSMALLTAFLQSDQSAANNGNPSQTLREVTKKLPSLLGMIFDKNLYEHPTDDPDNVNFLEHLVRHQAGNAPGVATADAMLDRFAVDLWKIAQEGGLTMANSDLAKTLTAFAMQMYYENPAAWGTDKELFTEIDGGLRFDRGEVATDLVNDAKGFYLYFRNYLLTMPVEERAAIYEQLPALRDWFIQAGSQAMTASAGTERAFMLGGDGADQLTGGSQADVLVGNNGNDTLIGGAGNDLMIGGRGVDTYIVEGNDSIRDTGRNLIVYQGQVLSGAFERLGTSDSYRFLDDSGITLTFDSSAHLQLSGTDSITLAEQTTSAAFSDGAFGIRLCEQVAADLVLTGTAYRDEMAIIDPGSNPLYWRLVFTSFPEGSTANTPFSDTPLTAVAPRLAVTGGEAGDFLFGFSRRDQIDGGGNDLDNQWRMAA